MVAFGDVGGVEGAFGVDASGAVLGAAHAQFETILDTISVQEIRERADYPGLRVTVAVSIGPRSGAAVWEVSTADPIVPPPRQVSIERVLGDPITLLGEAPETTIAEKGVAILEGGITSTRWRDCLDVVALARPRHRPRRLRRSARAVAVTATSPSNPSQHTWPAPAKSHKRNGSHGAQGTPGIGREAKLGDQITLVASYLDPGFAHGPE